MGFFHSMREKLLHLIYPKKCAFCGHILPDDKAVCAECAADLPWIEDPICPVCGRGTAFCNCTGKFYFRRCIAPFYYDGRAKNAVWRLKFRGQVEVAPVLAFYMAKCARRRYGEFPADVIVFVPSGKKAMKRRGFNQAELLAGHLSSLLELPVVPALAKERENQTQHTVGAQERWYNVLGAFSAAEENSVRGKTVLLVDDVCTTGATLNECARVLLGAGAKEIFCLTCALTRSSRLVKALKISYNVEKSAQKVVKPTQIEIPDRIDS